MRVEMSEERERRMFQMSKQISDLMYGLPAADVMCVCLGMMWVSVRAVTSDAEREALIPTLLKFIDELQDRERPQ